MTFKERYYLEGTAWWERVMIMNIYHNLALVKDPKWTIQQTADDFGASIGTTSENLRIARGIDKYKGIIDCRTRMEALTKLDGME